MKKSIIIMLLILMLICSVIFLKIGDQRAKYQNNYPYPQLYDNVSSKCSSLTDIEYYEDPDTQSITGYLTVYDESVKYKVGIARQVSNNEKYFSAYFDSNQFKTRLETENMYAIRYDMKEHKLMNVNNYKEITPSLKFAFEEEMKKRLESC